MTFLLETVLFVSLVYLIFYLPGRFTLRFFKYNFEFWQELPIATVCGLVIFILINYLLSWLKMDFIYSYGVVILSLALFIKDIKNKHRISLKNLPYPELGLILLGSGAMLFITMNSAVLVERGMIFYGINARDGIYHMSLVSSMMKHFPPTHPELSGVALQGYHFFYDFLLAEMSKFYRLDYIDLIFRHFSAFVALIYGFSAFAISRFLKMPRYATLILLFLVYFAGGLELFWKPFWGTGAIYDTAINPLLVNIVNPPLLISMSILFTLFMLLFSKNKSILLPVILLGILPEVKVYAAVLVYVALSLVALFSFIKNRDYYYIKVIALSALVSVLVYAPFNLGAGGLAFAPFTLYRHTIESFSSRWGLEMQVYTSAGNIVKISLFYVIAILVYFLPTLGLRLFSLMSLKKISRKTFDNDGYLFLGLVVITSFSLTTFFVQTVDPLNIVQFLWVAYIVLLIPTALAINSICSTLFKDKLYARVIVFAFVALLSVPHILDIWHSYTQSVYYIERDRLTMSSYIKNHIPEDKGVMVLNVDNGRDINALPEIAALSGHSTFYEATITTFVPSQAISLKRKQEVSDIGSVLKNCTGSVGDIVKKSMNQNNNNYILTLTNYPCLDSLSGFTRVVKSGDHSLFRLEK